MSAKKRLCIVKDNRELIKIIPFTDKGSVGFKLILRASVEIRLFNINYVNVVHLGKLSTPDSELEFTYHSSGKGLKPVIHYKTESVHGRKYYNIPFNMLAEASSNQIIPIPLCKIVCNDCSIYPEHHFKSVNKRHFLGNEIEHNMDRHNIAEIYMVPPYYKSYFDKLLDIWDIFFFTANMLPIEYFSIATPENISVKASSMGNGRNLIHSTIDEFDEKAGFMVCTYHSEEAAIASHNYFSLFENGLALEHLAATRLCYENASGERSEIKPLYQWQLEKNYSKLPRAEWAEWNNFFSVAHRRIGSNLRGIILQNI